MTLDLPEEEPMEAVEYCGLRHLSSLTRLCLSGVGGAAVSQTWHWLRCLSSLQVGGQDIWSG